MSRMLVTSLLVALTYFYVSQGETFQCKKILSMASGRNYSVFYAKEQMWLVICLGKRAQYRFRIKEVEGGGNCVKGLDLKNFEI